MKIGCLGPSGSYSEIAAAKLSPSAKVVLYKNFPAVVNALKKGEVDEIALPIENTIQGGVLQNMDLLEREENLFAVEEYDLKIEHRLVLQAGASLEDITKIYSHPQAIGQCIEFLSEKMPFAVPMPVSSTTEGLSKAQGKNEACIVGLHTCQGLKGYSVYPANIADEKVNYTRFVLVKKGENYLNKHSRRIYFAARLLHRPGSLFRLLGVIDGYGLNMTKIESRPIKDKPGEYRFFIEIEGDYLAPEIKNALADMKKLCQYFKLLGCY